MTLHKVLGPDGCSLRAPAGRTFSSLRVPAALALAAFLVVCCGASGPTTAPTAALGASTAVPATPPASGPADPG
ncbi:MAG TPA: hypothetical protein VER83_00300, partial [Candidatus Nanopelagicales bacterium]|nr:hypothetical protein [Candidatus Nanopelagicales bacterium]